MSDLRNIPIEKIRRCRKLLRPVRKTSLEYHELSDSIKKDGILQPILVRPISGDLFEVVEGSYRFEVALDCALETVPCKVEEMSDAKLLIIQLKANSLRPLTKPCEFADRIYELIQSKQYTMPQLTAELCKSPQWIRKMLKIRTLKESVRVAVDRGEISIQSAAALARLPRKLQGAFEQDAVIMNSEEFQERVRIALKEYREYIKSGKEEFYEIVRRESIPYVRSLKILKNEINNASAAGYVLKQMGAKTAMDGWRCCLAWTLHLNPDDVSDREENKKHLELDRETMREKRRESRRILEKLSTIGDQNE